MDGAGCTVFVSNGEDRCGQALEAEVDALLVFFSTLRGAGVRLGRLTHLLCSANLANC